jgi:hypothetical protein
LVFLGGDFLNAGPTLAADCPKPASLRRSFTLVGLCAFATAFTMVDRGLVGLPVKFLLKERLGLGPTQLSLFLTLALAPIYLKPLTGYLSDAMPLFVPGARPTWCWVRPWPAWAGYCCRWFHCGPGSCWAACSW